MLCHENYFLTPPIALNKINPVSVKITVDNEWGDINFNDFMDELNRVCEGRSGVTSAFEPVANFVRPTCGQTAYSLLYNGNRTLVTDVF